MNVNRQDLNRSEFSFDRHIQNFTKKGDEIIGRCPFHDDRTPSFSGNSKSGLWKCFANCGSGNWYQFLARLGQTPIQKNARDLAKADGAPGFVTEATYYYQDVLGETVLKIVRKRDSLSRKKKFLQYSRQGCGWVPRTFAGEVAPYRYGEWRKRNFIILVEGEKVVDYLWSLGIPATTTPGGASNWRQTFARFFADKTVVILPDHDPPGRLYAEAALADIRKFAKIVRTVELPDLQDKEDAYDWFEVRGGGRPLLKQILLKELSK